MTEKYVGLHAYVSGRVQGVFFRQNLAKQSKRWQIKGWVRNLETGQVECELFGELENIKKISQWLHSGPLLAKVSQVEINEIEWKSFADFKILR